MPLLLIAGHKALLASNEVIHLYSILIIFETSSKLELGNSWGFVSNSSIFECFRVLRVIFKIIQMNENSLGTILLKKSSPSNNHHCNII